MKQKKIAIVGAGPSGLFMLKRLVETGRQDLEVDIFEKSDALGMGMPYGPLGANDEHITNVSDNEIPTLVTSIKEWAADEASQQLLQRFKIDPQHFNEYKVLPRLFFGEYLSAQFMLLLKQAKHAGMTVRTHLETKVLDIIDQPENDKVSVQTALGTTEFDVVIISTGHRWPKKWEGKTEGYFDSPYPPSKLCFKANHPIAIRGASLTAIDALRTLSRANGTFKHDGNGKLSFQLHPDCPDFKLVMHSKKGLLPGIRFHLEDSHLSSDALLTPEQIAHNIEENGGFLSLDYVFEHDFKDAFIQKDPEFYQQIRHMNLEEFVAAMMDLREKMDPFELFKAEYNEAETSIKRQQSIYWKEMLAILSFAMNHPAKHFSAEDMLRLKNVLMPLIAIVIAFVPQSSCQEVIALHDAGVLDLISVDAESEVLPQEKGGIVYKYTNEKGEGIEIEYKTFIDCIGQPALFYGDLPFKSLLTERTVSPAQLRFKSVEAGQAASASGNKNVVHDNAGQYYLNVPGIAINDSFQVLNSYGAYNPRIYMMAVPYISGFNPDYSGLDFGEAASAYIVESLFKA